MSRASPSVSLRAVVLLVVVLTQLLSPLLHGHLGTPKQAGLHVHTAFPAAVDSHFRSLDFSHREASVQEVNVFDHDLALTSREPFEIDVEPAISPFDLAAFLLAAGPVASVLTFILLAALACCAVLRPAFRPAPIRARWRDQGSRPPPAQAPPLFS